VSDGPVLTTERLELWRPRASDRPLLEAMMEPAAVREYLGAMEPSTPDVFTRLLRNAGSWSLYGYGTFMVRERGEQAIVGNCGVFHSWRGLGDDFDDKPEAGWILAEQAFGRGIAHEAMTAALGWFDSTHGPRTIVAMIDPGNAPSLRLAAKLGFEPTRVAALPGAEETVQLFARPVPLGTSAESAEVPARACRSVLGRS
jgi:RimJ/RimL family protein N-acetyltransferase